jgi:hypothetical protein
MNKESNIILDSEFGIDSRYKTNIEQKQDAISLLESRLAKLKNLSLEQIIEAKLVQLKLQMEKILDNGLTQTEQHFIPFLTKYIDILYTQRNKFSEEIKIPSNLLSKILNEHREANDDFIQKVMLHSEKKFKNINAFNSIIWYRLFYNDKINAVISEQKKWRKVIEKKH